ncbi:MAG: spore cortex biosynthesis protein YabQ [Ruminococcus sp.]|nr:spore cortex biosynthesis protein YabQ [Ruminococcus sp.]
MNVPETFFSVREELVLFALSCLMGFLLGFVYDVFRTARVILPHKNWMVFAEDAAFLVFYGIVLSAFVSAASRGELRFYFVIGNTAGFVLYLATVGSVVIAAMKKLCYFVKKTIWVVSLPMRTFYVFISKKATVKFVGCSKFIVNTIKKIGILLLKRLNLLYNKKESKMKRNVTESAEKVKARKKRSVQ